MIRVTIKTRLVATGLGICCILIILGSVVKLKLDSAFEQYSILGATDGLISDEHQLRSLEKEFLLKEASSIDFFKNGATPVLDTFNVQMAVVAKGVKELLYNATVKELLLDEEIRQLQDNLEQYHIAVCDLKTAVLKKGFKDFGLVGKMRSKIHSIETIVEEENNLLYSKYMLTLRRHEKDYLLREDLKYKKKFDKTVSLFLDRVSRDGSDNAEEIEKHLLQYQALFHKVIDADVNIGLKRGEGIVADINKSAVAAEENLAFIRTKISKSAESKIDETVLSLFVIILLLSAAILVIVFFNSTYIVSSLKSLKKYITRLGKGELPQEIEIKGLDEIGEMKQSINVLTENLKQTRDFVIAVGEGCFDKEISVFNGEGELGRNLINMREQLLKVANEQHEQSVQTEHRMWVNDGVRHFNELMREKYHDFKEHAYILVKELVKYIDASQAGMFVRQSGINSEQFDLMSAYAYGRRKFMDKKVVLGEGIAGACAFEGQTIYITDVPAEYVDLEMGLGNVKPSSVLVVPLKCDDNVLGLVEIASLNKLDDNTILFVEKIAENIASHLYHIQINNKTAELLAKTQMQAKDAEEKEQELRQSLEEVMVVQENHKAKEDELFSELETYKKEVDRLTRIIVDLKKKKPKQFDFDDMYV